MFYLLTNFLSQLAYIIKGYLLFQSKIRPSNSKLTSWFLLTGQSWWGFRFPIPSAAAHLSLYGIGSYYIVAAWQLSPRERKRSWQDPKKRKNWNVGTISCSVSMRQNTQSYQKMQNTQIFRLPNMPGNHWWINVSLQNTRLWQMCRN